MLLYLGTKTYIHKKKVISNINVKAMTFGEHQKSCASNLLLSIK